MSDFAVLDTTGPKILGEAGAMIVLDVAMSEGADLVVIPRERLHPDMLELSTRQLGLFLQKLVNYQRQAVLLGDFSDLTAGSKPFHDFVYESNRGHHVWFLRDMDELEQKLG